MSSRAVFHNPTQGFLWHVLAIVLTLMLVNSIGKNVSAAITTRGGGEPKLLGR